ncbi:hypothetical protein PISMIDRAFT_350632 [Pisolithus microcarpus 441]|uniref:Uncharacterized protein n=1 Tax=Pisolithus microcarpus 441 TaxID=765257 RepID=A0A0C9YCY9_9AGAM|nr:hypothetical protein BKA83DRAFT_350632 [Pisolithus microcarpus]KIK14531.1 hypothetical protein PISMIDRAFT_350632 [Pisolithus microcarpus 441]
MGPVAFFPNMRIASGDGVLVKNTVNQFEVWLTGNVDYGVCTYKHDANRARVLEASLDDLMMYTGNRIMLVEAKRDKEMLTTWWFRRKHLIHYLCSDGSWTGTNHADAKTILYYESRLS